MRSASLSFGQAPPLWVPFRFFVSAPPFGLAACLVLLWAGPDAFVSRWTPALLAITHLLTIGFLAMVMMGALVQVLAVVAGARLPGGSTTAAWVHGALAAGATLLAGGFLALRPWLLATGAAALAAGFGMAIAACLLALRRAKSAGPVVTAARLALVALFVATMLGATLALALALGWPMPLEKLTNLHLQWGLIGWVLLLVAGVATQVVPMFQTTPEYSVRAVRAFCWITFFGLAAAAAAMIAGGPLWSLAAQTVLALSVAAFALYTLVLQSRRRRRAADPTLQLWRAGMWCLLVASTLWFAARIWPLAQWRGYDPLLGTLAIFGFAVSVVNGMLCRIAPFLAWLHMQAAARGTAIPPTLKRILPDRWCAQQGMAHCTALALLIAAAIWPQPFAHAAALAAAVSFLLLWRNLLHTLGVCRAFRATVPVGCGDRACGQSKRSGFSAHPMR